MADIRTLLAQARRDGTIERIIRNPLAQFGPTGRRYLGAELMPERLVDSNAYAENLIKYRTVIANAGTRYSPVQKKGGSLVGSFDVKLAESDIGSELTGREYDALLSVLGRNASLDAMVQLTRWIDATLNLPLVEWIERARWQAIVNAVVLLRGDNEYTEDVAYSNPSGHRVAAGGVWSNDSYDPWADITAGAQKLADKGYTLNRIVTSRKVVGILAGNDIVKTRTGVIRINVGAGGALTRATGRASIEQINAAAQEDGLPAFELYDLQYRTSTTSGRFLPDTVMVMFGSTGREEQLDLGDTGTLPAEILTDTIGYAAVGRAAGQSAPGRVVHSRVIDDSKPPRVEGEAWQTALPVIYEPEAIFVITGIA